MSNEVSNQGDSKSTRQRILRMLTVLSGHEVTGLSQAQCARLLKSSESRTHEDLRLGADVGFTERLASGNWRLGPALVQIARAHEEGLSDMKNRLAEVERRYGSAA
jgi:DNA-binding IclR family transcriptional regulator